MRAIYQPNTANYPRLKTDVFFADYGNRYSYEGFVDGAIRYIEKIQLLDATLWRRFVQQFRKDSDRDTGWRGEFWGKMMRGACFTYSYTQNEELYAVLEQTVSDMIESADETGRISSYGADHEFDGWDIWCRKYVLLGMQYFLEICKDKELEKRIIKSLCEQTDYMISKIGQSSEGKKPIVTATRNWRGLNSCSLLEPIVRLYTITGEQKYFDFATYIVGFGGTAVANLFDLAYEDGLKPYQYPITKAYEMTSCFEGLLEYYRHTGIEKYKTAVINFANSVLETDFTVIGSCGCTHELFDHSTVRQANTTNEWIQQETCVTVTLMKFFYQLTLLTGDSKYVDAFELSLYNAYFGAINTDGRIDAEVLSGSPDWIREPLPFDSYSPLTAGARGRRPGGFKVMSDNHYYGCCACIGSAGNGMIPKMQLLSTETGFAMNLYINGSAESTTPSGSKIVFETKTAYPTDGKVEVVLHPTKAESFTLLLRNPAWSKTTAITLNGTPVEVTDGYVSLNRTWQDGDTVVLELDMRTEAIYPIPYGEQVLMNSLSWGYDYTVPTYDKEDPLAKHHIALRRGPIMLAQENRLGYSVDDPIEVKVNADGYVDVEIDQDMEVPYPCVVKARVPLTDGSKMLVTDYGSAGKLWNEESKMAVWMLTK